MLPTLRPAGAGPAVRRRGPLLRRAAAHISVAEEAGISVTPLKADERTSSARPVRSETGPAGDVSPKEADATDTMRPFWRTFTASIHRYSPSIGQASKAFTLSSISPHNRLTSFLEMPLRLTFVQSLLADC